METPRARGEIKIIRLAVEILKVTLQERLVGQSNEVLHPVGRRPVQGLVFHQNRINPPIGLVSLNATERPVAVTATESDPLETAHADFSISTITVIAPIDSGVTRAAVAADVAPMKAHRIAGPLYCI